MSNETIVPSSGATQANAEPITNLCFLGLDGLPIVDLKVRITVDGEVFNRQTDVHGRLPAQKCSPDLPIKTEVQRFDGSYKLVDEGTTPSSDSRLTYTSPAMVLEVATELHGGDPGQIEQAIPHFEEGDLGVIELVDAPPVSDSYREEGYNHRTYVAASQPAQVILQTKRLPDPAHATAPKTGKETPIQSGRDDKGNPLMVYVGKIRDWWGRWHFWGVANASTQSEPSSTASKTAVVVYTGSMQSQVQALIDFATEQITYDYSGGTATIYAQMRGGNFKHKKDEKPAPRIGPGRCYQWVRLALARTDITEGYLADEKAATYAEQESASMAGAPLLRKGFKDVTDTLPDARWAAAGDVIVYAWTDKHWESRKKEKGRPNLPNFGHIDIRSYEAYISDFIPLTKSPAWKNYTNVRIYRKIFDPLPTARIRAFLHCLRDFECQSEKNEAKRYGMLNYPLPDGQRTFGGYKAHPWKDLPLPDAIKQRKASTAAGAYQITRDTWEGVFKDGYITLASGADLFSPAIQDRIAVVLLETTKSALCLVRAGKTQEAVSAASGRWSSLPGGGDNAKRRNADGKPLDMNYFMGLYEKYLIQEKETESIK